MVRSLLLIFILLFVVGCEGTTVKNNSDPTIANNVHGLVACKDDYVYYLDYNGLYKNTFDMNNKEFVYEVSNVKNINVVNNEIIFLRGARSAQSHSETVNKQEGYLYIFDSIDEEVYTTIVTSDMSRLEGMIPQDTFINYYAGEIKLSYSTWTQHGEDTVTVCYSIADYKSSDKYILIYLEPKIIANRNGYNTYLLREEYPCYVLCLDLENKLYKFVDSSSDTAGIIKLYGIIGDECYYYKYSDHEIDYLSYNMTTEETKEFWIDTNNDKLLAIVDDKIFYQTEQNNKNYLICYDSVSGKETSIFDGKYGYSNNIIVFDNSIYFVTEGGNIYKVDEKNNYSCEQLNGSWPGDLYVIGTKICAGDPENLYFCYDTQN